MKVDLASVFEFLPASHLDWSDRCALVLRVAGAAAEEAALDLSVILSWCESGAEERLAAALWGYFVRDSVVKAKTAGDFLTRGRPGSPWTLEFEFQRRVDEYRCDFVLRLSHRSLGGEAVKSSREFVVEVDGHDFHEKTKAQAAKDKRRDRKLTALGYAVLRFTGSEVFRAPDDCVTEVVRALSDSQQKAGGEP